ncbi:uncharacterized protein EAE97_004403 [Botrytis byssoidea]|uniref:Uncharacterized protein n=1 Tax=Botrytis byssoidea TaxID=139641 RepID=A0A9P5IMK9_9HELO|nr:uncharacterized protein EAE97_004403 [Botrytis byssoidea]KAF7947154.1 hypothetical protein EAE97_004403 [Botrytis byssoidea]
MTDQNYPDPTTVNSSVDSSQTQTQATAKTVSADPVPIFEKAIHISGSTAGSTVKAKIGGDDNNVTPVDQTWRELPLFVSLESIAENIELSQMRLLERLSDLDHLSSLIATMPLPMSRIWSEQLSMLYNGVQQDREAMKSFIDRVCRDVDEIRGEVQRWHDVAKSLATCQQPE